MSCGLVHPLILMLCGLVHPLIVLSSSGAGSAATFGAGGAAMCGLVHPLLVLL